MFINNNTISALRLRNTILSSANINTTDLEQMLACIIGEVLPEIRYFDMKQIAAKCIETAVNNSLQAALVTVDGYAGH